MMWHAGEPKDGVLWVEINWTDRPVNALSRATLAELSQLLSSVQANSAIRGVIFKSGKSGNFIAGADVTEFQKLQSPDEARDFVESGQQVFDNLAALSIPTVALISGACLGGGLEFALACRYRIADDSRKTQLGLPEVKLGIVPGWGGTVRLPRAVGFMEAVPMLLTGRTLNGRQAARKGLVHDAVPNEALDYVAREILQSEGRNVRPHRLRGAARLVNALGPLKKLVLWQATKQVLATTHGHYPAPFEIINVLRDGLGQTHEEQLRLVREANARLGESPVTRELVRLFFLSEGGQKGSCERRRRGRCRFHSPGRGDRRRGDGSRHRALDGSPPDLDAPQRSQSGVCRQRDEDGPKARLLRRAGASGLRRSRESRPSTISARRPIIAD